MNEEQILKYADSKDINITRPLEVKVPTFPMCDIEECRENATYSLTIATYRDIYNLWHTCPDDAIEALRQADEVAEFDEDIVLEIMVTP